MMALDLGSRMRYENEEMKPKTREKYEEIKGSFEEKYQGWYTEATALVRQLIPDRLNEFQKLYLGDNKRKEVNLLTFTIQDWLHGFRSSSSPMGEKRFDDRSCTVTRFRMQRSILGAVESRFESSLHDVRQLVRADLFDSELEMAGELLKTGFLRAAGAVAGVVLEKHLGQVAENHSVRLY